MLSEYENCKNKFYDVNISVLYSISSIPSVRPSPAFAWLFHGNKQQASEQSFLVLCTAFSNKLTLCELSRNERWKIDFALNVCPLLWNCPTGLFVCPLLWNCPTGLFVCPLLWNCPTGLFVCPLMWNCPTGLFVCPLLWNCPTGLFVCPLLWNCPTGLFQASHSVIKLNIEFLKLCHKFS